MSRLEISKATAVLYNYITAVALFRYAAVISVINFVYS
jgi:hypothetical protein